MTTTNDIAKRVTKAIMEDPAEARLFIERTIADALPLIVKAEWDSDYGPDFAVDVTERIGSHYEPTSGDVDVIASEYMFAYDEIEDHFKEPHRELDVWARRDSNEDVEYEANTYRENDGDYRIDWYHVDVGIVTSETFGDYAEAQKWYEENGYTQSA